MIRPFYEALAVGVMLSTCVPVGGQSIEYLPPIQWETPPAVDPGPTDSSPPADAVVLFDGKDLSAWENGEHWSVQDGAMVCGSGSVFSRRHFGDCQLHIEWSAPETVEGDGQERGNSGVFLMGRYEVQVLDSFENPTYVEGQAAAIYKQTPPMVNVTRPPGEWNSYDILWKAPRFKDGELETPAYVTVLHNGVLVVHDHELWGDTAWYRPSRWEDIGQKGPIRLQDHGSPVRFRNIWVRELVAPVGAERPAKYIDHATGREWLAKEP